MFTLHPSPTDTIRARSLRVAFVLLVFFLVVLLIFFIVVRLIFFFFVWLLSTNEDIVSYRAVKGFWVEAFWTYFAHAQWYASYPLASAASLFSPCSRNLAPALAPQVGREVAKTAILGDGQIEKNILLLALGVSFRIASSRGHANANAARLETKRSRQLDTKRP